MVAITSKILDDALSLPVEERVILVEGLLNSLNLPLQPDIECKWQQEAERRLSQIESGEVATVPFEDVMAKIRGQHGAIA